MATLHRSGRRPAASDKPAMLVTAAPALLQRVPEKAVLLRASYSAKVGNSVGCGAIWNAISRSTATAAPRPCRNAASSPSAAAVIDVYPPAAEEPVRLDLFGDTLESIRAFDPETQRSTRQLREIQLAAGQRGPAGQGRHRAVPQRLYPRVRRAGRRSAVRHDQRGRPPRRPGALAAAVLRADGDAVRLPARRRPDRRRPPGRREVATSAWR